MDKSTERNFNFVPNQGVPCPLRGTFHSNINLSEVLDLARYGLASKPFGRGRKTNKDGSSQFASTRIPRR